MTDVITSRSNPRVRWAASLRDRRTREAEGRTLVDGVREVGRALERGVAIEVAFLREASARRETTIRRGASAERDAAAGEATVGDPAAAGATLGDGNVGDDARLEADLRRAGVEIVRLGGAAFERLAFGDRTDGVVAVVRPPDTSLANLADRLGPDALIVVLEGVEKPGNLGAVLRSADGAGASAVIVADPRTDPWNPNAIRASLGTIFAVPVAVASTADALEWLARRRFRIVAARVDAPQPYDAVDLTGSVAIVLGAEATGLSDAWSGRDTVAVRLPMLGIADSLNVSTAAAVLLYESRRQRDARARH